MKKRAPRAIRNSTQLAIYLILLVVGIFFIGRSFYNSLFVKHPDRISVVVYGQKTALYSLGKTDRTNYFTYIYPDLKVVVPGGYGYYRIGALGKLISLEKKPELMTRIFSMASSSFVNYYFYPKSEAIYYGGQETDEVFLPKVKQIWLDASNASLFDRLYLWLTFATAKKSDFSNRDSYPIKNQQQEKLLDDSNMAKRYQGFFYHKTYREEKKTVQIIYSEDYNSAVIVSRILEGSGIRVVDISQEDTQPEVCTLTEEGERYSKTAKDLATFLHCKRISGKARVSDIILELADQEQVWSRE